jgi:hypothetical protein
LNILPSTLFDLLTLLALLFTPRRICIILIYFAVGVLEKRTT